MPAMKTGEGYAKDATSLQRVIRRLSDDADPVFAERNIRRLQEVVNDFNDHTMARMKNRPADVAPAPAPADKAGSRKRNGSKSAEA